METEEFFLIFAVLLLFFDFVQLVRAKPRQKRKIEYGFYAATFAFGLIVISYFMLVQAFLNNDFSLREVYSYSSSSLPAASKVYATWAGAGGSILLLTLLIGIAYFAFRFRTYEKTSSSGIAASGILNFMLIFFLILTIVKNPFARFPGMPLDGIGLNPQLQTFWMIMHPPIVFSAYVFILLAFALTLANMKTGVKKEDRLLTISLQSAWLLLTIGIAIGGIWAYEVLGWGGYWAWDPVETSSLMTWLALTAYFHLGPLSGNKSFSKELMILIAFAALIFLSALTRGGLRQSVHAYALSPAGPLLLLLALGMAIYFFYLKRKEDKPLFALEARKSSLYSVSLLLGFLSLCFIFLVCFFGVAFPIILGFFSANPPIPSADFYNIWSFPFVIAFVAALIGCSLHEKMGVRSFAPTAAGSIVAGFVLVQLQLPTQNVLANMGIPLLTVGLLAVAYKLARTIMDKRRTVKQLGRSLLHVGIIVTLIGVFLSASAKQVSTVTAKPNSALDTLGLSIDVRNFTIYAGSGSVYSPEFDEVIPESSALKLDVDVRQGSRVYGESLWIRLYMNYGVVSTPLIIHTETGDIYLHLGLTESMYNALLQALIGEEIPPEDLIMTVETVPMIYLVWAGVALLSIGIALQLVKEITRPRSEKTERLAQ